MSEPNEREIRAKALEDWVALRWDMGSHDPYVDWTTREQDMWHARQYAREIREGKR